MNGSITNTVSEPSITEGQSPASRDAGQLPFRVSFRTKGFLVFSAVVAYAILLSVFILYQKASLLDDFTRLQNIREIEGQLRVVEQAASHVSMAVYSNAGAINQQAGLRHLQADLSILYLKNAELRKHLPFLGVNLAKAEHEIAHLATNFSAAKSVALGHELLAAKKELSAQVEQYRKKEKVMSERFRMQSDSVAITSLLLGLFGLGLLGAIIGLFFTRLTSDLHALKDRALDIVRGDRGSPIPVNRNDEVGELMQAVNHMADLLDEREKELVIARQSYFQHEKMIAVGALAAGVAHEIGNPIAAMSGVVQEMIDKQKARECVVMGKACNAKMLQAQIQRLSAITREISGFASPQAAERQLLDLNELVRTSAGLMRYDKRMHKVDLQLNLDNQLPAIYGVADQLTQVVMNLLINTADALKSVNDRQRVSTISSEVSGPNVCLMVTDNGCGMDLDTLNRAFNAFFTTKKKGTGLGLSLCYSIVIGHDGSIEIDSMPNIGTQVKIYLPLPAEDEVDIR